MLQIIIVQIQKIYLALEFLYLFQVYSTFLMIVYVHIKMNFQSLSTQELKVESGSLEMCQETQKSQPDT